MAVPKKVHEAAVASLQPVVVTTKSRRTDYVRVTVALPREALLIAHALAAATTADRDDDEPWDIVAVLEAALYEGLVAEEKETLRTRSLDESIRGDANDELPNTTPAMAALVKAAIKEVGFGQLPKPSTPDAAAADASVSQADGRGARSMKKPRQQFNPLSDVTLLDLFAAAALVGLVRLTEDDENAIAVAHAVAAYDLAEAMLQERTRRSLQRPAASAPEAT